MVEPTWPDDEIAWAKECFVAGDSLDEIAEAAGRSVADVRTVLGSGRSITPRDREILSLYAAGCTFEEIAQELQIGGCGYKVPAETITRLRRKGVAVPYRNSRRDDLKVAANG